jgi:pimeloyl-ACP methyl ester carboxylesterase
VTRYTYIVPGIYTELADARSWDYQAQAWLFNHGCGVAAGFHYFADVLGGLLSRDHFADMVASDLLQAQQSGLGPIDVAAHSNGCAIVLRALLKEPRVKVRNLHLIAAAVDANCALNGLNTLAESRQVGKGVLYVSPDDEALQVGPLVGYGDLGRRGPVNLRPMLAGIVDRVDRDCRHCDWVAKFFEQTMQRIAGEETAGVQWKPAAPPAVV